MEKYYVYEPAEDSDLLLKNVLDYLDKIFKNNFMYEKSRNIRISSEVIKRELNILEVGVGSGYVIYNIFKKYPYFNYFGTDINEYALNETRKKFKESGKRLFLRKCNLFPSSKTLYKNFDMILFNPPYLPEEENFLLDKDREKDSEERLNKDIEMNNLVLMYNDTLMKKALYGGRTGIEVLRDFFKKVNFFLKDEGVIFVLVSSLSSYTNLFNFLELIGFNYEIIDRNRFFFEELFCVKVTKSDFLKKISKIKEIDFLAKGKHSIVLSGLFNGKKVVIKKGREEFITKESYFLKKLEMYSFVPKVYFFEKDFVVMEYIRGSLIEDFIITASTEDVIKVINKILFITYTLDKSKINKFEFINPKKHIFIIVNKRGISIKLIDFERSLFSENPKNTRQILQYLKNPQIKRILNDKGLIIDDVKIIKLGKEISRKIKRIKLKDFLVSL